MKELILKIINDNSVPHKSSEYGEGIFADVDAVGSIADSLVELFSKQIVIKPRLKYEELNKQEKGFYNYEVERFSSMGIAAPTGMILDDIRRTREGV